MLVGCYHTSRLLVTRTELSPLSLCGCGRELDERLRSFDASILHELDASRGMALLHASLLECAIEGAVMRS